MRKGRPWIPPSTLLIAQIAHGAAWVMLFVLATDGALAVPSMRSLAWVHLVVLGWLTMVALPVLLFVVPQSTEARWRGEGLARVGLGAYAVGAFALVAGFWSADFAVLALGAGTLAIGLAAYLTAAGMTLLAVAHRPGTEAAIARALLAVFAFLGIAALIGAAMAGSLGRFSGASALGASPRVHAAVAGIGWLTLLIMGVSARTIGPIAGAKSANRRRHIISGALVSVAVISLAAGMWAHSLVATKAGEALACAGVAVFAFDLLTVVMRAPDPHRPPQAFVAAAAMWLIMAAVLGVGASAGKPWTNAFVFVGLVGWMGQMVNGHLHHIGVRLMATVARGDDDETSPGALLSLPASWLCWGLFQAAVALGVAGLLLSAPSAVRLAALFGGCGWLTMVANARIAWRRAIAPEIQAAR
ncbi:MAG: hypothetical protein GIW99_06460 [Candidatus Eremiobacteraeota bacterium]|nr:hypothetical protein [Candidatus Eremiobacteraeota bacterium]MBC5827309.1 hypothetical protein [Candidatus Eremiobacteraeota bacterium]